MSMELIVIVALESISDTASFNARARELLVPIAFEENINLVEHSGFLPSITKELVTGVEFYMSSYEEIEPDLPPLNEFEISNPAVITFRWGGDFTEGATAMFAAAVLTANESGVAFDLMSGTYITSEQLLEGAEIMISYGLDSK